MIILPLKVLQMGGVILYSQVQVKSHNMYKIKSQKVYKSQIEVKFSVVGQKQLKQNLLVWQLSILALMGVPL